MTESEDEADNGIANVERYEVQDVRTLVGSEVGKIRVEKGALGCEEWDEESAICTHNDGLLDRASPEMRFAVSYVSMNWSVDTMGRQCQISPGATGVAPSTARCPSHLMLERVRAGPPLTSVGTRACSPAIDGSRARSPRSASRVPCVVTNVNDDQDMTCMHHPT